MGVLVHVCVNTLLLCYRLWLKIHTPVCRCAAFACITLGSNHYIQPQNQERLNNMNYYEFPMFLSVLIFWPLNSLHKVWYIILLKSVLRFWRFSWPYMQLSIFYEKRRLINLCSNTTQARFVEKLKYFEWVVIWYLWI